MRTGDKFSTEQHSFDVQIARIWNIEKAVILKEIAGWCRINERKNHNEAHGFYWTYNSSNAYAKHFGYMSDKKVDRLIREMEQDGIIFGHKFYVHRGNQTKSHTVNWELYEKMIYSGQYCKESATNFIEYLSSKISNAILKNEESSILKNEESSILKNEESYTPPSFTSLSSPSSDTTPNGDTDKFKGFDDIKDFKTRVGKKQHDLMYQLCDTDEAFYKAFKKSYKYDGDVSDEIKYAKGTPTGGRFELFVEFLEYRNEIKKPFNAKSGIKTLYLQKFALVTFDKLRHSIDEMKASGWQSIHHHEERKCFGKQPKPDAPIRTLPLGQRRRID